ncbi:hypothetical protein KA047_03225 [Candidatus Saccharibacteria bacterium]|nr:hypothetical protein [Candidatus Saccharibacteria bacterium]
MSAIESMPVETATWENMRNCYGFESTPVEFRRQAITDIAARGVCKGCVVRSQCTDELKEVLVTERVAQD